MTSRQKMLPLNNAHIQKAASCSELFLVASITNMANPFKRKTHPKIRIPSRHEKTCSMQRANHTAPSKYGNSDQTDCHSWQPAKTNLCYIPAAMSETSPSTTRRVGGDQNGSLSLMACRRAIRNAPTTANTAVSGHSRVKAIGESKWKTIPIIAAATPTHRQIT